LFFPFFCLQAGIIAGPPKQNTACVQSTQAIGMNFPRFFAIKM